MKKLLTYFLLFLVFIFLILIGLYYINQSNEEALRPVKKLIPENLKIIVKKTIFYLPETNKKILSLETSNKKLNSQVNKLNNKIIKLSQQKNIVNSEIFPQTQFLNLKFEEVSLNKFIKEKNVPYENSYFKRDGEEIFSFYIDSLEDNLILFDKSGNSNFLNLNDLSDFKLIKNNLPKNINITDTLIIRDNIFVALSHNEKDCGNFFIYYAFLNLNKLEFKNLYFYDPSNGQNCKNLPIGGRIAYEKQNNNLIYTSQDYNINDVNINNQYEDNKEYKFSVVSKINLDTKIVEIMSTGHRNPQGLLVTEDNFIISTEHGPRGGDEINHIKNNKNYGWPEVSYGENYNSGYNQNENYIYKKNHKFYGYEEPIFAFLPSIGISQIIELNNNFSDKWIDNFLVTSLRGQSVYRIKFDEKYSKIIYSEKIFIGKRIRDINYNKKNKKIILALENNEGSLGVISN